MRASVGLLIVFGMYCVPAMAQDGLTLDFSGRIGIGTLTSETATDGFPPVGFSYDGVVLRAEGTGTVDYSISDNFGLGAVAKFSLTKGQQAYFDLITPPAFGSPGKFDSQDVDLAVYSVLGPVTLSFGEMQTAFERATRKVETGGSIIDGGNAVWQSIGDGKGSLGSVDSNRLGPGVTGDFTTLRADIALSDFVFSVSNSRRATMGTYLDAGTFARSEGLTWQRDIGAGNIFVGIGRDRGPEYEFKSASVGWEIEGLNLVVSKVERTLAPDSFRLADYAISFSGLSASYEFGDYEIGFATSNQGNPTFYRTFAGTGTAFWFEWDPRENVSVDFEFSRSDYFDSTTQDTKKASLAISYDF
jgi:hypothetical protein